MAEMFDAVSAGYFQPFGNLAPDQVYCRDFTRNNLDELLFCRQREKYFREVRVCVGGFGPADEEEPLEDASFSQYQFFKPYTEDLVFFVDKFDFLIKAVATGVCKVQTGFEDRYEQAILEAMTFRQVTVPAKPEQILDLRQVSTPRIFSEQKRTAEEKQDMFKSYVTRRNSFSKKIKAELESLQMEQYEAERQRGEHLSQMGWEEDEKGQPHPRHADANAGSTEATKEGGEEEGRAEDDVNEEAAAAEGQEQVEEDDPGNNAQTGQQASSPAGKHHSIETFIAAAAADGGDATATDSTKQPVPGLRLLASC